MLNCNQGIWNYGVFKDGTINCVGEIEKIEKLNDDIDNWREKTTPDFMKLEKDSFLVEGKSSLRGFFST